MYVPVEIHIEMFVVTFASDKINNWHIHAIQSAEQHHTKPSDTARSVTPDMQNERPKGCSVCTSIYITLSNG